jgi:hypothetical protein
MSSAAVIDKSCNLPPAARAEVIQFTLRLGRERALTSAQLTSLARSRVESDAPGGEEFKCAIVRGLCRETGVTKANR